LSTSDPQAPAVAVLPVTAAAAARAEAIAERLGVACLDPEQADAPDELLLVRVDNRIELRPPCSWGLPDFHIDYLSGALGHRLRQGVHAAPMLARACGVRGRSCPHILDLTAGLGRDGMLLASLGCQVTLVERQPLVGLLLEDALLRAAQALPWVRERVELIVTDALESSDLPVCEVAYLDPMFPARDKTAQVKKEMQLFHRLVGRDSDSDRLLERARGLAHQRIVVKRPRKAPFLANRPPSGSITGKTTRYDIYPVT